MLQNAPTVPIKALPRSVETKAGVGTGIPSCGNLKAGFPWARHHSSNSVLQVLSSPGQYLNLEESRLPLDRQRPTLDIHRHWTCLEMILQDSGPWFCTSRNGEMDTQGLRSGLVFLS
ncbi:hypothetical protein F2Q70_00035770 [Brassica cretica]|uniref:Uncharacterized protein n=1 Tax=Brassica cretica TaxID=69181 RepID=A0A8S9JP40_BRACR|nr:hypothetical protein F2Q70_00035770 [Brassica cretica]